jgi:hypothetical protein
MNVRAIPADPEPSVSTSTVVTCVSALLVHLVTLTLGVAVLTSVSPTLVDLMQGVIMKEDPTAASVHKAFKATLANNAWMWMSASRTPAEEMLCASIRRGAISVPVSRASLETPSLPAPTLMSALSSPILVVKEPYVETQTLVLYASVHLASVGMAMLLVKLRRFGPCVNPTLTALTMQCARLVNASVDLDLWLSAHYVLT